MVWVCISANGVLVKTRVCVCHDMAGYLPSGSHTPGVNHTPAPDDLVWLLHKDATETQSSLDHG